LVLRKKYGKELKMSGGIPKSCLSGGPSAIDAEIDKLMPLIQEGGFIPALDDMVSPEVPLETYRYFIRKIKTLSL
jgi:uroporphyrinogen decarboxylase